MGVVQSIVLALGIAGALATVGSRVVPAPEPSVASFAASEDATVSGVAQELWAEHGLGLVEAFARAAGDPSVDLVVDAYEVERWALAASDHPEFFDGLRIGVEYPDGTFAAGPGEPGSGPAQAAADAARHLAEGPGPQAHEPPPCSVLGALPESAGYVVVYECQGSPSDFAVVAVDAPNVADVVTAAVRSLGHLPDDPLEGLSTVFEPSHIDTATVTVTGSEATVSLPPAFAAGGYGRSSAIQRSVLDQLSLTVFANSTVEAIGFEIDGSCQAFWDELESPDDCYRAERIHGWSALTGIQAYEFVEE